LNHDSDSDSDSDRSDILLGLAALINADAYRRRSCDWSELKTRPLAEKLEMLLQLMFNRFDFLVGESL
jgi:hypothetical protein